MSTILEELTELEAKRKAAISRYGEALQAYYPAATITHEILIHHDGSVIVAVPMPEDDEASIALGEYMAHIGPNCSWKPISALYFLSDRHLHFS